jgi:2-polyprenyl-3-methyl-5-hydroxy-6-metoxy-1,4-benzoquinol methylase
MKHKPNIHANPSVTSNSAVAPAEGSESREAESSFPSKWGMGERVVPEHMANDPASRRLTEASIRRYEIAARYTKGKRVLDIACGGGYGSRILRLAGASSVIGVDVCAETLQHAKEQYQIPGVEFICADAQQFDWQERFDVVVSFETIEHLDHPDKFLERIRSLLVPGGDFILSVPLGETRHFDAYHLHAFSQEEVFALLERAGFSVELYRCDELFLTRSELVRLGQEYPESNPTIRNLCFTPRGWRIVYDFVFRGGFHIPTLLVTSRLLDNPVVEPQGKSLC